MNNSVVATFGNNIIGMSFHAICKTYIALIRGIHDIFVKHYVYVEVDILTVDIFKNLMK